MKQQRRIHAAQRSSSISMMIHIISIVMARDLDIPRVVIE
jgi:hypothetical protein